MMLGKRSAGDYRLSSVHLASGSTPMDAYASSLMDARKQKATPFVRGDYDGLWWNPANNGKGLPIWQDARDHVWLVYDTYNENGGAAWHTFEPTWEAPTQTNPVPSLEAICNANH
jgi:hypothetical protein